MEEYGLIGGSTVNRISEKVNEKLTRGIIHGSTTWSGLSHFSQRVRVDRGGIKSLDKILVMDTAFLREKETMDNRQVANRALSEFLELESLVRRELKGVFLILYTKSPILDGLVKNHYKKDKISKYERTHYILATEGYRATGTARVLEAEYVEDDKKEKYSNYHEVDVKKKMKEQAEIYKLLGKHEELKNQADVIGKKLNMVNKQLQDILMGERSDDLDIIDAMADTKEPSSSLMDEIESILGD